MPPPLTKHRLTVGAVCGIGSAVLFGISAPAAKLLLPHVDAWILAGLLYAGAGAGLTVLRTVQRFAGRSSGARTHLQRGDLPLLLAIAVIGGGVGPVLMLVGLAHVSGVAGALLLNLEAVFTAFLAVTVFGEHLSAIEAIAIAIVIAGAVLISGPGGPFRAQVLGALAIAAACLAWGIDNNLTAKLSGRNAVDLVQFKALTAGTGNLALAYAAGRSIPALPVIAIALGVGFVSYGFSIVLDVYALRYVGAARESAFFATAPFAGALVAVPLLGEHVALPEIAAGLIMGIGVALLIAARRQAAYDEASCGDHGTL